MRVVDVFAAEGSIGAAPSVEAQAKGGRENADYRTNKSNLVLRSHLRRKQRSFKGSTDCENRC